MAVTTVWTNPTSAGMDINNNQPWTETVVDNYASDLLRLGGADGNTKTGELHLRESTVDHGVTTVLATDVFAALELSAAAGGLQITGIREGAATGVGLFAITDSEDTTHTTTSRAIVEAEGRRANGTATQAPAANANIFGVRSNNVAKMLVDQEGDLHVDGATSLAGFDGDDDLALVEGARLLMMRGQPEGYRADFARNLDAAKDTLAAAGVLSLNPDGSVAMVSLKGLFALLMDTVRQEGYRLRALEERVAPLLSVEARPYG